MIQEEFRNLEFSEIFGFKDEKEEDDENERRSSEEKEDPKLTALVADNSVKLKPLFVENPNPKPIVSDDSVPLKPLFVGKSWLKSSKSKRASAPERAFCSCPYCSFVTKFESDLESHMETDHQTDAYTDKTGQPLEDSIEDTTVEQSQPFEDDMTLEQDLEWDCEKCPKVFNKRKMRNSHEEKVHSYFRDEPEEDQREWEREMFMKNEKKKGRTKVARANGTVYECNYCEKTFNNSGNRHKHEKAMHINPKPHKVPVRKLSLKPVEQPVVVTDFKCNICDKYLEKEHYLEQHLEMTHFHCGKCFVTFEEKTEIRAHARRFHDPSVTYQTCHVCGQKFSNTQSNLFKHMRSLHLKESISVQKISIQNK